MSPRSIRRAAERKARKEARKAEKLQSTHQPAAPTRAEINRANAAHSTGPQSPEGKLASSRNSLKHGLASGQLIIPGEDPAAFESLLQDLLEDHQPANTTEGLLVREMAQSHWLMQRALKLQNDCFTESGIDEKRLALFLRYHTTHERAFHKALNILIRLQKDRRKENRGFVSQHSDSPNLELGFVSQNRLSNAPGAGFVSQNAPPPLMVEAA
ncbi:MAG TPA: hypothetical protein VMF91_18535 [Bryobacteraceae bacterium]|nr:hypothetical protein [Bryobacteraceae bacterium]